MIETLCRECSRFSSRNVIATNHMDGPKTTNCHAVTMIRGPRTTGVVMDFAKEHLTTVFHVNGMTEVAVQ